jgi:hypothetical protein
MLCIACALVYSYKQSAAQRLKEVDEARLLIDDHEEDIKERDRAWNIGRAPLSISLFVCLSLSVSISLSLSLSVCLSVSLSLSSSSSSLLACLN